MNRYNVTFSDHMPKFTSVTQNFCTKAYLIYFDFKYWFSNRFSIFFLEKYICLKTYVIYLFLTQFLWDVKYIICTFYIFFCRKRRYNTVIFDGVIGENMGTLYFGTTGRWVRFLKHVQLAIFGLSLIPRLTWI